jgi:hypothetical protein
MVLWKNLRPTYLGETDVMCDHNSLAQTRQMRVGSYTRPPLV